MCFVWIWEQTAIISLYSINWLVSITETECVYCVVRTGSLYIIHVICFVWISEQTAIISLYSINWLVSITETDCVYCVVRTGSLYIIQVMCFVWIWEQTAIISPYSINWPVSITETECVCCAARAEYLNMVQDSFSFVRGSIPGQFIWDLVWQKWHCDMFFPVYEYLFRPVSVILPLLHIFIFILLIPAGQTGEAWEPSKQQYAFGNPGSMDRNFFLTHFPSLTLKSLN